MGLEKAIEHGKEHRKPYRGSRRFDASCRNHGACGYCKGNRTHNLEKGAKFAEEDIKHIKLAKKANDFEEEHGWCPDYGYEVFEEAIDKKPMDKAPEGQVYVCSACGKTFKNPYEVDVSCMLNGVLCYEDSLEYGDGSRVVKAKAVEEEGI